MTTLFLSLPLALGLACGTDDGMDTGDMIGTGDGGVADGGSSDGGSSDGGASDGGSGDGGAGDGGTGDGGSSADTARIRVVHGSPDAPAVDIWVAGGDAPVVEDLAFSEATAYLEVPEGAYDFQVKVSPSTVDDSPVYSTGELTLPADATITALAAGLVGSTDDETAFRVMPLVESWAEDTDGTIHARIIHAAPDAPAVSLDIGNDGTPEISDFDLFADSDSLVPGGVALASDISAQVGIWAGDPLDRVTAFTIPALPAGTDVFVIAGGFLADEAREDTGFQLIAVPPEGDSLSIAQNPRVYALHASPNAPAVDIFAGEAELVSAAAYGDLAGPLQVPPGNYDLDFFAAVDGAERPSGDPAASANTGELEAGEVYLAAANGFLGGEPAFELQAWREGFELYDVDNVRVRVVHGSPDAPAVEVGPVADGMVSSLGAFTYGQDSGEEGISIGPGALTIGLALEGTTAPVVSFDLDLSSMAGARVMAIATGSLFDETAEPFALTIVDTSVSPWAVVAVDPN